ncbi:Rsc9p [Sporobolomyces salmoneus]|uniref:Rsc9p n=1 Tax=Sporobolomyces salmoneus TaxID=183962 RepID=UPI003181F282
MHAIAGRPSFASSSSHRPYAPPGSARPPRPAGDRERGPKGPSQRSKARERWSVLFAGPAYLEPGPSNRLILSLRSCVPAEVDFALERIIQVSSIDPDLLRFNEFPGLLDGLLGLIRDYLDRRIQDRQSGIQNLSLGGGGTSETREILRRRAAEASLILRNLALEKRSLEPLLESKRLRKMVVQVLEEGEIEGPLGEETTEIRLYLLELVELIGEHIPLVLPGHSIPLDSTEDPSTTLAISKPEPFDSPSVRLFPLLVNLTTSQDRALLLAAYRCLTTLSLNEKSDLVFSLLTYTHLSPLSNLGVPHPIETAINLLPLGDSELTTVVLDFIYQHTLLPSNSVLFCARPELTEILKLVCSKFELGGKVEEVETEVLETPSEAANWWKNQFGAMLNVERKKNKKKGVVMPTGESLLSEEEMEEIIRIQEPERAINWMHRMYTLSPISDITQVSLWTCYKTQFESIAQSQTPGIPNMLPAQDVIKLSSQAFPTAVPTIVDESEGGRKFIIKGLALRKRETVDGECGWQDCPNSKGHDDPLEFHQHVYNTHLVATPSSPPTSCHWTTCTYSVPSTSSDPAIQLAQIALHVRTHLPLLSSPSTTTPAQTEDVPLPKSITHHVRYHAQVDDYHHEATGPSFLSCLILRNLIRTIKIASSSTSSSSSSKPDSPPAGGRGNVASGHAAVDKLSEGSQSIFQAFLAAEESVGPSSSSSGGRRSGGGVLQQVEKPDYSGAIKGKEAFGNVRERVTRMALSNVVLGRYLVEVVTGIEGFEKGRNEGGEDGEGEVKMEE